MLITEEVFQKAIQSGVVLIDFATDRCEPCKQLDMLLPQLEKKYLGVIKIHKVSDENISLLETYNINNFPTLLIFKDGMMCETIKGVKELEVYISSIEYRLTHSPDSSDNDNPLYDISDL